MSPHRRSTNIAHFAGLDDIMESIHGFLRGCSGVETVNLQQIDVGQIESLQAGIDTLEDMLPTQSVLVEVAGVVLFIV